MGAGGIGRSGAAVTAAISAVLLCALALADVASASAPRYRLVKNCYALKSTGAGKLVAADGSGYTANAAASSAAALFRMQATDLGSYLLYGEQRNFLGIDALGGVHANAQPSPKADWEVTGRGDSFRLTSIGTGDALAVADDGTLEVVDSGSAAGAGRFSFVKAGGCPSYPEVEVDASGRPSTGSPRYGEVSGLAEGHMHGMAFEFLGGRAHCGRPWDRYGAPYALVDCPDHYPNGEGAVLENTVSYGNPVGTHDPVGWPTFEDWPNHASLTHEQSYYRWIERAWRGGLRVYTNLFVENRALCSLYPLKKNSCNEMTSVYRQARDIYAMQDYIDAQAGGPGKGFFRIVTNPFEARRVANQGKLAVILGMEASEPFGCRELNHNAMCTKDDIVRELDHLHRIGVRQLEIVNKFDNALTGVAGDSGSTGTITNTGNFYETGHFWDMEHCEDGDNSDRSPTTVHNDDAVIGNGLAALLTPPGATPVYPPEPLCNTQSLTALGAFAIRQIMKRHMIFDPDHMSVYARDDALNLLEARDYPGVISSHSWSTKDTLPRIYKLGGMVTPYAGNSEDFVDKWRQTRKAFSGKQYYGLGLGADMNGLGHQGEPRGANVPNPVEYPFKSFDGKVTLHKQHSGQRVFDINTDGVAHYGLYPDWIEDLRMLAGRRIVRDMGRGAEAYLQMWERAEGIPRVSCDVLHGGFFTHRGLGRQIRLGDGPKVVLRRAGQPVHRNRSWQWCARSRKPVGDRMREVDAVFDGSGQVGIVLSSLQKHQAGGIGPGAKLETLRAKHAVRFGHGLWVRSAGKDGSVYLYGVRGGRVRFTGVATEAIGSSRATLARYVRMADIH